MKFIVGDGEVVAWKTRWTCHVVSSVCREVETRCCTGQSRNFDWTVAVNCPWIRNISSVEME